MSKIYSGIYSFATINGSLSFKIKSDSFNKRWGLLAALPATEKLSEEAV